MKRKIFSLDDQKQFAELSGDYNPIHLNDVFSRRSLFGQIIVHGIHTVLWALDSNINELNITQRNISSLNVSFLKPVYLQQEVYTELIPKAESHSIINVVVAGETVTEIIVKTSEKERTNKGNQHSLVWGKPVKAEPQDINTQNINGLSGKVTLYSPLYMESNLFLNLKQYIPLKLLSLLLATSRMVGMICPGLHSLYSTLEVTLSNHCQEGKSVTQQCGELSYNVNRYISNIGLVQLDISSGLFRGTVRAFIRPKTVKQANMPEIQKLVCSTEFIGQRSLIIGGSRGLGEIAAKILCSGGAEVIFTYNKGEDEAHFLLNELLVHGSNANFIKYEIRDKEKLELSFLPTHIYYFATPKIEASKEGRYDHGLYRNYYEYYVSGLDNLLQNINKTCLKGLFYPSSIYLDMREPKFSEYVCAKYTGEMYCHLYGEQQGVSVYTPRLPKMLTDQTTSIMPQKYADNTVEIIKVLREFSKLVDSYNYNS